jgi:hypothetical protein
MTCRITSHQMLILQEDLYLMVVPSWYMYYLNCEINMLAHREIGPVEKS